MKSQFPIDSLVKNHLLLWIPPGSHKTQSFQHIVTCSHIQQNLHLVQMVSLSRVPFQIHSGEEYQAAIFVRASHDYLMRAASQARVPQHRDRAGHLTSSSILFRLFSFNISIVDSQSCLLFSGVLK